jgi:outer membrane protein assembly factor BamD (BamD/ComL family)
MTEDQRIDQKGRAMTRRSPLNATIVARPPRGLRAAAMLALLATALPLAARELPRTATAVMPFTVDGPAFADGQGNVIGELITAELLATGRHTVVERIQLDTATRELNLQATGQIDPTTAVAVGRRVGAQVVVIGTLAGTEQERLALARVVDVATGEVILARTMEVAGDSLLGVARSLVESLTEKENDLARDLFDRAERRARLGQTESALDAYEHLATRYSRTSVGPRAVIALARFHLDEGGYFDAADHAESVLETYPEHPLAEEALFLLAEAKYLTVYGDPDRVTDPRAFLKTWQDRQSGQAADPQESIRLKAALAQDAKQKYQLLLAEYPDTEHATVARQRLARINASGGH